MANTHAYKADQINWSASTRELFLASVAACGKTPAAANLIIQSGDWGPLIIGDEVTAYDLLEVVTETVKTLSSTPRNMFAKY